MKYMVIEINNPSQSMFGFLQPQSQQNEMPLTLAFGKIFETIDDAKKAISETQESVNEKALASIESCKKYPNLYPVTEEMCEEGAVLAVRNFIIVPIESLLIVSNDHTIHHETPTIKKDKE